MIAVDANILVYAHRPESPLHAQARAAMRTLAESSATWAIPWPCLHEFYAVVTRSSYYREPSSAEVALNQISLWVASPSLRLLSEAADHLVRLRQLVVPNTVGPAVHDAKIAAICLSHEVSELLTTDKDFTRFPALRTRGLVA